MLVRSMGGGDFTADSLFYRPLSSNVLSALQTNMANAFQYVTDACSQFKDFTLAMYNKYNSDEIRNRAKLVATNSTINFDPYAIHFLDYKNIPYAGIGMQRYIMAYPEMNKLYNRNCCYGFQDTYIDQEPGATGEDRLDYGQVVDGILQFDKDDTPYIMNYAFNSDDDELDIHQQSAIMRTWENVARWIAERKDPSDPTGEGEL